MEEVYRAAESGNLKVLKRYASRCTHLDIPDSQKWTVLHFACMGGNPEVVKYVIARDVGVNSKTNKGTSPLHIAAQNGNEFIIAILAESGAALDIADNEGCTPLHFAAMNGSTEATRILLEYGANPNMCDVHGVTPLHIAADKRNHEIAELLLQAKAKPNAIRRGKSQVHMITPMHNACKSGDTGMVNMMIEYGGSVDVTSNFGVSLLHVAAENPSDDMITLLLDRGANIEVLDKDGEYPLFVAVRSRCVENVRRLITEKTLNHRNNAGDSVLHIASHLGYADVLSALLEANPLVELQQENTLNTPLHFAVIAKRRDCVELLLEHGANPFAKNRRGQSPFVLASKDIHPVIRSYLDKHKDRSNEFRKSMIQQSAAPAKKSTTAKKPAAESTKRGTTTKQQEPAKKSQSRQSTTRIARSNISQKSEPPGEEYVEDYQDEITDLFEDTRNGLDRQLDLLRQALSDLQTDINASRKA